jgi:hypothetical protein
MHDVYSALHDPTPENKELLVREGLTYLKWHPGMVTFSAGLRAKEMRRDANDGGFDVSMHSVFLDAETTDVYQKAPRKKEFVARDKPGCEQVRVFDSYLLA